ncbi:unnamed protein product [Lactuca virosa]|uniref:Uncharacterized protein n=1 Tax=Lactuca virosa TaxID=75947 RepID=A0AAU9NEI9_9ASTR|nr:unnamed protein product [Lactuca virosa]
MHEVVNILDSCRSRVGVGLVKGMDMDKVGNFWSNCDGFEYFTKDWSWIGEIMEDIHDLDTIDVELDEYFKRKQISQCKDKFLNILYEEDDNGANDDVQPHINIEEADKEYMEGSDEEDTDDDLEYYTIT